MTYSNVVDGIEVDLGPTYVILHQSWQHNNSVIISNIILNSAINKLR
jgi:hypothetical protein